MARRSVPPPVRFSYDGLYASSLPGETLLQALARKRIPLLVRSVKYHRPRGPFCGIGQCAGCLVRVNGVPNVRACRSFPRSGDRVLSESGWPSVRFDLFHALDLLFPRHMDTLHGFRRPLWLRPLYHAVVRRLAGTGHLPDAPGELPPVPGGTPGGVGPDGAPSDAPADVLVVGGGTAGARAAVAIARAPSFPRVALVERRTAASFTPVLPSPLPANLVVRAGTSLVFLPPPSPRGEGFVGLAMREEGGAVELRARRVLLATGGYDASLLFTGNDRPGVLTGDGALALGAPASAPPFSRALLVGGGRRALEVLRALPDRFVAVCAPSALDPELAEEARGRRLELLPEHLLLAARGGRRVRGALLRERRPPGRRRTLRLDAIVLAHRRVPNVPLLFQAGARMVWDDGTGAYYPAVDPQGATSVPGLYVAGELVGAGGAARAEASADRAARALLGAAGPVPGGPTPPAPGAAPGPGGHELVPYYWELLRQPVRGKRVLCACEDVVAEELDEAVHDGFTGTEVIKRYTGVGTGICQGRYCLPDAILLLSLFEGRTAAEVGFITQRPPVWPTLLADLAHLPGTDTEARSAGAVAPSTPGAAPPGSLTEGHGHGA